MLRGRPKPLRERLWPDEEEPRRWSNDELHPQEEPVEALYGNNWILRAFEKPRERLGRPPKAGPNARESSPPVKPRKKNRSVASEA